MSKHKLVTVTKTRDVRIHADLWHTSKCLLEKGQKEEAGSEHQFKASLVFTAFTLEAYLNWLGERLFPHWNYLERLAPIEKLDVISDLLKVGVDNARRPWQTTKKLFRFRNAMAHGKPVTIETETETPVDEYFQEKLSEIDRTEWEKFCTREHAEQAREDVEEILRALHAAAGLDDQTDPFYCGLRFHKAELRFPKAPPQEPASS
jgi:hypothetical protein